MINALNLEIELFSIKYLDIASARFLLSFVVVIELGHFEFWVASDFGLILGNLNQVVFRLLQRADNGRSLPVHQIAQPFELWKNSRYFFSI